MTRIDTLIEKIEKLQYSKETKTFKTGMFPSIRFHSFLPYLREDNNIFFPASIAFLLLKYAGQLEERQRQKVNEIVNAIRNNYPLYSGLKKNFLYNFYQTNPSNHYPNGFILSRFKHFKLAEDADDTVIITMTLHDISSERINNIRDELVRFSNLNRKRVKGIGSQYSKLPVYGTWFGSGGMPIEIEICVLCNILYFTFINKLELKDQDKASIEFIRIAINNKDLVNNSFQISGMYPEPAVILYHITRLCSVMEEPRRYFDTERLIETIKYQLAKSKSLLERVILSTSLMNLGQEAEAVVWALEDDILTKDFRSFPFFIAPMLSGSSNKILALLKKSSAFHILFRCEAFYYTLLLEYEILVKSTSTNSSKKQTYS